MNIGCWYRGVRHVLRDPYARGLRRLIAKEDRTYWWKPGNWWRWARFWAAAEKWLDGRDCVGANHARTSE